MGLVEGEKIGEKLWHCISSDLSNKENIQFEMNHAMYYLSIRYSGSLYHISFDLQHKKSYSSRSKSINRYKMLVEAANDIIYETDTQGCFTYANPKALKAVGYSKEEVIGMRYADLIRDDHKERVVLFYQNQMAKGETTTYLEFPIVCANGEVIWIGQNVQILEDEYGILGMMSVARDITDRHVSDQLLMKSEEKYRGIIQNLQFGLLEVDLDETILYVNEAMCSITGYTADELIGNIASDILVPKQTKEIIDREHDKRAEGVASVYEVQLRHKNGKPIWCLISGAPNYNFDGDRIGSLGIHMDITGRKKDEEELIFTRSRLDKYRVGLELLNEMTSNIGLDLNCQINEGMKIAANYLNLPFGIVSRIEGDQYFVQYSYNENSTEELGEEARFDLCDTYCQITYAQGSKLAISNFSQSEFANHPAFEKFGLETYIASPYSVNGKKRGTVNFTSENARPQPFDAYDLEFIDLLAKYIGFIISQDENQKELAKEREALRLRNTKLSENESYLKAINGFVTKLLVKEDIVEIAWEIAENVIDEFGFNDCVVYVLNEEKRCLEQLALYGPNMSKDRTIVDPIQVKLGEGIVGHVAETGVAEIVSDTSKDSRYKDIDGVRLSEITVPIIADGKVIGVIDSEHKEKNFFKDEHLATLTTLANLASNRLKNAKAKIKQLKAERELRESENKLRTIISSALDGIITIDQKGLITEWNPQAEVIFGWKVEEVIGKPLTHNIIPSKHHSAHDAGMKNYFKTKEGPVLNQRIEITAMRKSGEEFPIELAILPIVRNGIHSFTAFVRDITIQKEVQNEMEKALNKERELNELKSRFVSMTSHEFRTPLTTIKQNTDLIAFKLENQFPEHFEGYNKYLDRIESEIGRVTFLMNDILMLGKIEAGRVELNKKPTDLHELVKKAITELTENRKDGRSIDFSVIGVVQPVNIDVNLFDHIVANLISNAFKYSEGKEDPKVTLSYEKTHEVKITFKDYGIGIPKKDQKGLFASFYRATNVKNIQGTGLGLSIVKEFVEMHGGTISVNSEQDMGSEFVVIIPAQ
ncbi:hypothetical protein MB14_09475 [Roseivirga ehrenbergii]|uniref:histidine kinase n=1 Tax=Roseivirga ehrenbergii (strain DSM 102268 / JCM 13514 / KCTC 12282 / NCIMB 14502 / KMM 6017) TaxID=279360 RepID=A0A150X0J9_ROSEK|nr:hypothetical protein MB14_09475 [Roseivirga ehrenbergii]